MSRFCTSLGAVALVAWFLWDLSRQASGFFASYGMVFAGSPVNALAALQLLGQVLGILYTLLIIVLLVVHDAPKTQAAGFAPFAAAFLGAFSTTCFFILPTVPLPIPVLAISALCVVLGLGLSIYALVYLGRSFAILPAARSLVIDGPYRFVRHPLYLFEEIAIFGIMLQFLQPWSALVMVVQFAAQLVRMRYEERALTEAFPAYRAYAIETARLIPGIY